MAIGTMAVTTPMTATTTTSQPAGRLDFGTVSSSKSLTTTYSGNQIGSSTTPASGSLYTNSSNVPARITLTPTTQSATKSGGLTTTHSGGPSVSSGSKPDPNLSRLTTQSIVFPIARNPDEKLGYHVNAKFLSHGAGRESDPNAYLKGNLHLGEDIRVDKNKATVYAPTDGKIVYYHTKSGAGTNDPEQTFIVLRDNSGRDYVIGHTKCTVCNSSGVGDSTAYPSSQVVTVSKGMAIGSVLSADATHPKYEPHLHFGLNSGQIVDAKGVLKPDFQHGQWGSLKYTEGDPKSLADAAQKAKSSGWLDPLTQIQSPWAFK